MTFIHIPLRHKDFDKNSKALEILEQALDCRKTTEQLFAEERYADALERTVEALRIIREFPDFENVEFRTVLVTLLFDLSEIYFTLKDYKQSEHHLDTLFKLLDKLMKEDADRFAKYHILAMELSTRILRSRRKTLELLAKQQIATGQLFEKVNSGVASATDKLVESLRKVAQLLAASGDYRAALKFYAEAIRYSKKRSGRVTAKEIRITIEMGEVMMRLRRMRPRAKRLLEAVLPSAIKLEEVQLENDILALIEVIDADIEHEPRWKAFIHKLSISGRDKSEKLKGNAIKDSEEQLEMRIDNAAHELFEEEMAGKKRN